MLHTGVWTLSLPLIVLYLITIIIDKVDERLLRYTPFFVWIPSAFNHQMLLAFFFGTCCSLGWTKVLLCIYVITVVFEIFMRLMEAILLQHLNR